MWDTLTCRRQLRRGHEIDVEQPIAVVVEQGDAAAGRFEDVVLGRSAAIHFRGQPRTHFEGHRHGRAVFGRWDVRRRGTHRRRVAPVRRIFGLRLAVASLEREAERDVPLELRPRFFEERERQGRSPTRRLAVSPDARAVSSDAARRSSPRSDGSRRVLCRRCCGRGVWIRSGTQCFETAAGIEQRASNLIGRRSRTRRLLQLGDGVALQFQQPGALLRLRPCLLRRSCRHECADRTKRRGQREHNRRRFRTRANPVALDVHCECQHPGLALADEAIESILGSG